MKFFDRTNELEMLADIERRSRNNAQFTVLAGRRRVGKTEASGISVGRCAG